MTHILFAYLIGLKRASTSLAYSIINLICVPPSFCTETIEKNNNENKDFESTNTKRKIGNLVDVTPTKWRGRENKIWKYRFIIHNNNKKRKYGKSRSMKNLSRDIKIYRQIMLFHCYRHPNRPPTIHNRYVLYVLYIYKNMSSLCSLSHSLSLSIYLCPSLSLSVYVFFFWIGFVIHALHCTPTLIRFSVTRNWNEWINLLLP